MYELDTERFEKVYSIERGHLRSRDVEIVHDELPPRLVRKFIRPSAFFNADGRKALLEKLFHTSPGYVPDRGEAARVGPLAAPLAWQSCLCLPLNDRDELLGLLVIACPRPQAFGPAVTEALQPLRGLASLAIARRLHAKGRITPEMRAREEQHRRAVATLHERTRQLEADLESAKGENEARGATLQSVMRELEHARTQPRTEDTGRAQLQRQAAALEDQVAAAGELLSDAYAQLADTQSRMGEVEATLAFVREAFDVIAADPDAGSVTRKFVAWFSERFQADRCTLMRVDDHSNDLRILACSGLDPSIAANVRLGMGQGVAGWVAQQQQPVLMRHRQEDAPVRHTDVDTYNSDSFMSLPLVHRKRVVGVLNLSNKRDGDTFDETDFDRARLASHVLAIALGEREKARPVV
jgi:GAF domain-containing protein